MPCHAPCPLLLFRETHVAATQQLSETALRWTDFCTRCLCNSMAWGWGGFGGRGTCPPSLRGTFEFLFELHSCTCLVVVFSVGFREPVNRSGFLRILFSSCLVRMWAGTLPSPAVPLASESLSAAAAPHPFPLQTSGDTGARKKLPGRQPTWKREPQASRPAFGHHRAVHQNRIFVLPVETFCEPQKLVRCCTSFF